MNDKVDAKGKKDKTKPKPSSSENPISTDIVLEEKIKANKQSAPPQQPDEAAQKSVRNVWRFFAEIFSPIIIAIATVVITGVTYFQWTATDGQLAEMKAATKQVDASLKILKEQTDIARETLISSQRAWLAPMNVAIEAPYANGNEMKFVVYYQNVGREPAINSRWAIRLLSVIASPLNPPSDLGSSNADLCKIAEVSQSRTSNYPSDAAQYKLYYSRTMKEPIGKIISGNEIAYIEGCFRYETYGITRESRFCFFWISTESKNWQEWEWRFCPKGNEGN